MKTKIKRKKENLPDNNTPNTLIPPVHQEFNTGETEIDISMGRLLPEDEESLSEKLDFGFSFSSGEGRLGDENEYTGDLSDGEKKTGNRYDPGLPTGNPGPHDQGTDLHVIGAEDVGLSFGEDAYTEEEDEDDEDPENNIY